MTAFRWPRGRYNGLLITGFSVKLGVDLLTWFWRPRIGYRFSRHFHWLCFRCWFETGYDHSYRAARRVK